MHKSNRTCTKKVANVKVNLNCLWKIDYELFWLYIYIHGRFKLFHINVVTGFMTFLFLVAPAPRVRRAWDLIRTSVQNGLRFFLLFGKKCYFKQKLSFLMNNFFGNVFLTYSFNNSTVCETHFNSWKKVFFNLKFHWRPSFNKFCIISMFNAVSLSSDGMVICT